MRSHIPGREAVDTISISSKIMSSKAIDHENKIVADNKISEFLQLHEKTLAVGLFGLVSTTILVAGVTLIKCLYIERPPLCGIKRHVDHVTA